MAKSNKKQILVFKTFTVKQFIWFVLGACFFLTGVALIIMYYLCEYLPYGSHSYKVLNSALSTFNSGTHTTIGFIGWGIICFLLGALLITIVLSLSSKLEDREKERKARRELRLNSLRKNEDDAIVEEVIDTINKENKSA